MTHTTWFDTRDETEAFVRGLNIGGQHESFIRESRPKWEVRYWKLW